MRARFLILFIFLFSAPAVFAQLTSVGCPTGHVRYYQDSDGDGYGKDSVEGCYTSQPSGYVIFGGDCNDNDASINPTTTWYEDQDNDGKGDPNSSVTQCVGPRGYVRNGNDQCPNEYAATPNGCPSAPDPDPDPEPEPVSGSLSDRNYVHMIDFTKPFSSIPSSPTTDDLIEEVTYLDGLGRPMQNLKINHAVNAGEFEDVITEIVYDTYGRQLRDYLPYAKGTTTPGAYQSKDLTQVRNFYWQHYPDDFTSQTATNAYSEKLLEASPLGRVLKQAAPGSGWKIGSGHEIEFDYQTNVSGSSSGKVRHFEVSLSGGYDNPTLISSGYYPAGALFKNVTRDENHTGTTKNHTTEEFTNRKGQTVLKRTYNNGIAHDTYYVYDDYGNLSFVLPPLTNSTSALPTTTERNELCYQYKYDQRNRLIEKKVPGKGWEYIVYNKLDQPVMTQDAIQRSKNEWLFTKYDAFGRVAYTGLYKSSTTKTRTYLQSLVENGNYSSEYVIRSSSNTFAGTAVYYNNSTIPSGIEEVYTINYYDNYTNLNIGFSIPSTNALGESIIKGINTKGLATVSKTRVLGTSHWITKAMGYDDKGRVIWSKTTNPYLGTTDIVSHEVDFSGNILQTQTRHQKSGKSDIVITDTYTYDYLKRLKKHTQNINGGDEELIALNEYDELGQLKIKEVGNTSTSALQEITYNYNVRGWLKDINDVGNTNKLFNFRISYNDPSSGTPLYNGNISRTDWRTDNDEDDVKNYRYYYDDLNRLTSASAKSSNYSVSNIGYDKNGNIEHLTRRGAINSGASSFGNMDVLSYAYNASSNKLRRVNDSGNDIYGFKDGSSATTQYSYDVNGNLTSNLNKGIAAGGIEYNHLNLPTSITLPGGAITYTYDAYGSKLKKVVHGATTDYAGNFVYKNGLMEFFSTPEGYVSYDNGQFNYVYNYVDHLGNVRLSYTDANGNGSIDPSTEIIEENNYYPFGLKHEGYNTGISPHGSDAGKKYKYQNQELENSLSYDMHEFELRHYDATIGRFVTTDPYEQFASPYLAMGNNPVVSFDPDGGQCYDINGNVINCPDDEIYDDYRDNEKNNITVMDEVDLDEEENVAEEESNIVIFASSGFTPISQLRGLDRMEATIAMNLQGYRVEEGLGGNYHVNAAGEITFGPYQSGLGAVGLIGGAGKPINLPSLKKMTIDMKHIISGHTLGGARASSIKSLFPSNLTTAQIEKLIKSAYKNAKKIKTQGYRVKVRGTSDNGSTIEMWINTNTRTIETAYPLK